MTVKPTTDTSSGASPGQSERREKLIRIYDELDDAGKQELLRHAEELRALVSRSPTAAHTIEDIYRSSNGDRWRLIRDTAPGRVFVRHEANQASGGSVTDMDVDDFLSVGGSGPEHTALRRLLDRP
jgi:hypothetical protein